MFNEEAVDRQSHSRYNYRSVRASCYAMERPEGREVAVLHTEKSFQNLIKSTRNQTFFTISRLIWIQTEVRLDPDQSKSVKYNLISG